MVTIWLRFFFRQVAIALVTITSILLLSEILLPASILPYFNLHILVLITITIAAISPAIEEKGRARAIAIIPIFGLLLVYAWLIFGMSASGLMLLAALAILVVGLTIALIRHEPVAATFEGVEVVMTKETIIIEGDKLEILQEETDVFMR